MINDRDPDINGVTSDENIRVIPFTKLSRVGATVTMNANGSFHLRSPAGCFDWLIQGQPTNDTFTYTLMDHSLTIANDDGFSVQGNSSSNTLPCPGQRCPSFTGGRRPDDRRRSPLPARPGPSPLTAPPITLFTFTGAKLSVGRRRNFLLTNTRIRMGSGGSDFARRHDHRDSGPAQRQTSSANPDSFTVAKGTTVSLDVLANDNILPASGAALTIVSVGAPRSRRCGGTQWYRSQYNRSPTRPNSANTFPLIETLTYVVSGGGIAPRYGHVSIPGH